MGGGGGWTGVLPDEYNAGRERQGSDYMIPMQSKPGKEGSEDTSGVRDNEKMNRCHGVVKEMLASGF